MCHGCLFYGSISQHSTRLNQGAHQTSPVQACELIGCRTNSFVDIMDASAGHTAELVEVNASWHAVKTHHVAFMQFRTAVWSAMNASAAFHENFTGFIYHPGRAKGSKRVNPICKETGDVLSTALALHRKDPNEPCLNLCGTT